jgi:ABC-type lipoprotein release transport system permease subunit
VAIRKVVEFSAEAWPEGEGQFVKFELQNPVSFELTNLDEIFQLLRSVFVVIGVVFVVFASLLFSNFIATSISYKKREIGILRAIGSRSNDVFRIFFAESFVIAMINFVVSLTGTAVICGVINHLVRNEAGLLLTVLNVGIRQVALLLGICLLVALVASFLPVRRIAAKRPIDAIRDR